MTSEGKSGSRRTVEFKKKKAEQLLSADQFNGEKREETKLNEEYSETQRKPRISTQTRTSIG